MCFSTRAVRVEGSFALREVENVAALPARRQRGERRLQLGVGRELGGEAREALSISSVFFFRHLLPGALDLDRFVQRTPSARRFELGHLVDGL